MSELAAEPRMLIDGKLVEAASGATYGNINPATEAVAGEVADAGPDDMNRAIEAARRAFDETDWSTNPAFRQRCLQQLKDALDKEKETLRPQIVTEVGAPIMLTYAVQQDSCIEDMQWEIDLIDRYEWERVLPPHEFMGMQSNRKVVHEPVGVVGAITPWNFPFMLNLSKITPALAAGNTVVLKPAPDTPWSATFIGRVAAEQTDIPPGVLNIVTSGDPATVGEMLTNDPRVDMVSFTGSTATGRRIMANGAETLKKVFLELGGKSANVILDDADFATAVPSGSMICMHGGQACAKLHPHLPVVALPGLQPDRCTCRRPDGSGQHHGAAVTARQRGRVPATPRRARRRSQVARRRRPSAAPRQGVLRRADVVRRCRPRRDDRPGRDLRSRAVRVEVRRRRRRRAHREQLAVRVVGRRGEQVAGAGAERRPPIRTGTVSVNGGLWFGPDRGLAVTAQRHWLAGITRDRADHFGASARSPGRRVGGVP
jgi:aldehyde dehydrogenase (NAD+)